jgi:hypothetical protein
MMSGVIEHIIAKHDSQRPFYANKNWRLWSPKHTKIKVVDRHNGYFSLALRDDNPAIPRSRGDGLHRSQFVFLAFARFKTFYDAMVGAKALLDWLQEPFREADLFTETGKPCYSIQSARFAIRKTNKGYDVYDLDERYVISFADTREAAIRDMMELGTYNGTIVKCI